MGERSVPLAGHRVAHRDTVAQTSDAADVRLDIEQALSFREPSSPWAVAARPAAVPRRERLIWASGVAISLVIAGVFGMRGALQEEAPAPLVRFELFPPEGGDFTRSGGVPRFAISPDGRYLVFAATPGPGKPDQLWLRRLDSTEAKPIAGTESTEGSLLPQTPFWSPDSRYVGFFVQAGSVRKIFPPSPGSGRPR